MDVLSAHALRGNIRARHVGQGRGPRRGENALVLDRQVQLQKLAPVLALHIAGRQPILFLCASRLRLSRRRIRAADSVFAGCFAPSKCENLRERRLATAFDRKLPKLAKWKAAGAVSVLILETSDIALTNHILVAEAVQKLLHSRADRPDQIWLVDTVLAHVSFFGT
jgi:hypothetical protein